MIMAWHYVMIWSALEICIGNLHCFCEGKHPLFAIKVEVMFITLLHYDPHLHKMKAEPSQTLTSEVKHRNDTSCRYILLLIYPLLLISDDILYRQSAVDIHMVSTPVLSSKPSFIASQQTNMCKYTYANKHVQTNMCKSTYANKHVQTNMCK